MPANRFLEKNARTRVAGFVTSTYPDPTQSFPYQELARLALALGAETEVFHWTMPDPRQLPSGMLPLVGTGFYVPPRHFIYANDLEHVRQTMPERYARLMQLLTVATGISESDLLARTDVLNAFSHTRWLRAWHADLLVSWYVFEPTVFAFVASFLLGVPHVLCLSSLNENSRHAGLLCMIASHAGLVVVDSEALREQVVARCGPGIRERVVVREDRGIASESVITKLRPMLAPAPGAPARGPDAAFFTRRRPPAPRLPGARPFLLLGAERTGSNLLVLLLAVQARIGCAGELFNPRFLEDGRLPWIDPREPVPEELRRLRASDPGALHARLLADATARRLSWIGFKLLYFHAAIDDRIVEALAPDRAMPIVHLVRKDRLRRCLSHQRAMQTDKWFTAAGASASSEAAPLRLDVDTVLGDFALVELLEERFRAVFAGHPFVEMTYEELSTDLPGTARRLSELFGLPIDPRPPKSTKTGSDRLADGIANFAEICDALAGTRWSEFVAGERPTAAPQAAVVHRSGTELYQHLDYPHYDYLPTRIPGGGQLTFRGPAADVSRPFVACIGAAQTFGRFVERPFPSLLSERLGVPFLNLGLGGVGPRFWLEPSILSGLQHARLVVVQVMAGRSASNSLFDNTAGGGLNGRVVATGEKMRFEQFLQQVVDGGDRALLERVVAETRDDYVATMLQLGKELRVPTVLLWLSRRPPAYRVDWTKSFGILNHFPQLLDQRVVDQIRPAFSAYVECVSEEGVPQRLWRARAAVDGTQLGPDGFLYNDYYPSPAMHRRAAELLAPVCRRLLG